ncbi:unnamed protein product [Ilex paraguariensis]|uniref:Uncharacterized protein n=1 Tax=Ilex paraguariensis TaxID=185542 RepID=A0ABC8TJ64_9AQUA
MGIDNWLLLGRLKRAVKKIKFLLNFDISRWKLAAAIGASSSKRQLSFNGRPGLTACTDDPDPNDSGSSHGLQRTMSVRSEDDIDKRAELFIANFKKQLQFERQISLQLRYCRGNSFESASPSPRGERLKRMTKKGTLLSGENSGGSMANVFGSSSFKLVGGQGGGGASFAIARGLGNTHGLACQNSTRHD